jgi:GWxTD domain-containing protein
MSFLNDKQAQVLLCFVLLAFLALPVRAQRYSLYAHAYMDAQKRSSIKVSCAVTYDNLVFLKRADFYEATYELFLSLKDAKGHVAETAVLKRTITAANYNETRSSKNSSKLSKTFLAGPGKYVLEATLVVKNTLLRSQKMVEITVPDFLAGGLGLSKPRLYAISRNAASQISSLVRTDVVAQSAIKPLEYDAFADLNREPAIEFEIYAEKIPVDSLPCRLYMEVVDSKKNQLFYGNSFVRLSGIKDEFFVSLNVDDWEPGSYKFVVRAALDNPRREAEASMEFAIELSRSMLGKYFDQTLAVLEIIATSEELKELKTAAPEDRAKAWTDFWKKRDPTPGTETNEAMEEYLRRMHYAIANFSNLEPGWKTDRGRVYIRYGQPDQVESTMDAYLQGEYLIWRYFDRNIVVIFYDRFGVGDYRLISINGS